MHLKPLALILSSTVLLSGCLGQFTEEWRTETAKLINVEGKAYKVSKFVNQLGYHSVPAKVPVVSVGVPLAVSQGNLKAIEIVSGCTIDPTSVQNEGYHTRTLVICD